MTQTIDIRGRSTSVIASPVLMDPSGRRARRLARGGRVLALVFVLWLCGLALAWVGLLPTDVVPLGPRLAPTTAPSPLRAAPRLQSPDRAELAPAVTAQQARLLAAAHPGTALALRLSTAANGVTVASAVHLRPVAASPKGTHTKPVAGRPTTGVSAPGSGIGTTGHGNSSSAPGHTGTQPGHTGTSGAGSGTAGATGSTGTITTAVSTTGSGQSASAPGHGGTSPGNSGSSSGSSSTAPGHVSGTTTGHGHSH